MDTDVDSLCHAFQAIALICDLTGFPLLFHVCRGGGFSWYGPASLFVSYHQACLGLSTAEVMLCSSAWGHQQMMKE
jgi:hypothetical protein